MRITRQTASALSLALLAFWTAAFLPACSPPPANLKPEPASVSVTAKFGDEVAPAKTISLKLKGDQPDQSVGWTASVPPGWLAASSAAGGTPADLTLTVDHAAIKYGSNEAVVRFETKQGPVQVPVAFAALGCLAVSPSQAVTLEVDVGKSSSSAVSLTVDSPGKPGLRWTVKTDDPWLKVTPTEGETPSKITVSADPSMAANGITGRLTFQADSTWKGSPTVIPVAFHSLDPISIAKQVDAKKEHVKEEIAKFERDLAAKFTESLKTRTPDALIESLKKGSEEMEAQEALVRASMAELIGFLDEKREYEQKLAFGETRTWVEKVRSEKEARLQQVKEAVKGITQVTVPVSANAGDWKDLGISVKTGSILGFQTDPKKMWTLGQFGQVLLNPLTSGPGGIPKNPQGRFPYGDKSLEPSWPHGCLLVRIGNGAPFMAAGAGFFVVDGEGGVVSARCNDKKCTDNSGSLPLRIVVVPISK